MRNYRKIDITVDLLRQIGATNGAGLMIRDLQKPGYYWRVFQEYRVGTRHGDVLRWEKRHVLADRPLAPPEVTPVDTTGGVLLKQGRSAQIVKYRPGLNAALAAAGVFQFYTRPTTKIYTDVPTKVLVYMPGAGTAIELGTPFGGIINIPEGASRIIETRQELDGSTTKIVFASGYADFKEWLASELVSKMKSGWIPENEILKKSIKNFIEED